MDKLISVVVPVYNVEKYLEQCVDSILAQTYKNFEIILTDDGSTDSSGRMCDEFAKKDSRIKSVHRKNGGLSAARNTGLSNSSGEYVYFLDSDDYIVPEALTLLIDKAEKEGAEIVFFDAVSFDEETGEKCRKQNYIRRTGYGMASGKEMLALQQKRSDFHSSVPLMFFRRDFLLENRLEFIEGILYEDMVFTFQALSLAKCVTQLEKVLYMRRYREGSIVKSKKNAKNFLSSLSVYEHIVKFAKENNLNDDSSREYIANRAFNAIEIYRALAPIERAQYKGGYRKLINSIKSNRAFGNKSLLARCFGLVPWAVSKGFDKIRGR
ncbi:MAG: glycosyltransferase [Clostridia bacterium]|nr:glycosyltransferase [Clostridia bacterium]